jgi:hypothetical protein
MFPELFSLNISDLNTQKTDWRQKWKSDSSSRRNDRKGAAAPFFNM